MIRFSPSKSRHRDFTGRAIRVRVQVPRAVLLQDERSAHSALLLPDRVFALVFGLC